MDAPLTTWYCDVCGDPIDDIERAYVIWKATDDGEAHDFRIIHQKQCDRQGFPASMPLKAFLGEAGLAYVLSMLSVGPLKAELDEIPRVRIVNMHEFVDFVRRVQTPFYEEARRHFGEETVLGQYSDATEVFPYLPEQLRRIAEEHSA